ncbi:MAG: transposase [Christensenellales bacterium]
MKALLVQKLLGLTTDVQLLSVLKYSSELRNYCEVAKVPVSSQIARFKQCYAKESALEVSSCPYLSTVCSCIFILCTSIT